VRFVEKIDMINGKNGIRNMVNTNKLDEKFEEFMEKIQRIINKDMDSAVRCLLQLFYIQGWHDSKN